MKWNASRNNDGLKAMSQSTVAICSIVRNCNKNLKRNIKVIEKLRSYFKDSLVFVFENDSTDGTKSTLKYWESSYSSVFVSMTDLGVQTIAKQKDSGVNRYYALHRIQKMASFRNQYLDEVRRLTMKPDFLLVVDLDVEFIEIKGVVDSFGYADYWDMVAANGYSFSPTGKRRYHDAFALVEKGEENIPQTEHSIVQKQQKWSSLKPGMKLQPVYSAHGGLSIYRYEAIQGLSYETLANNDSRVETRCEHFSICDGMEHNGFKRRFINPSMVLRYQTINKAMLIRYFRKYILNEKD